MRRRTIATSIWLAAVMALVVSTAAGCGDNRAAPPDDLDAAGPPPDAAVDAPDLPPDPFAGMYDDPGDFPRGNCRPGTLTGFAHRGIWLDLGLRTTVDAGVLSTFVAFFGGDALTPHTLTADDLFIRRSAFNPINNRWTTQSMTVCGADPDGTLYGAQVSCFGTRCLTPRPFAAAPTERIAGETEGSGLTRLGEVALDGLLFNVRVAGDVAYVAAGAAGLHTVSIADPAAPVRLGTYRPHANDYNDVKLIDAAGRHYAVMSGPATTDVIDVTQPTSPQLVAQLTAGSHTLFIEGHLAYLADGGTTTLRIYDLTDPRAPRLRSEQDLAVSDFAAFHDLYVEDGIAYLSASFHGLAVVDCRDPDAPVLLAATDPDRLERYWHSPWRTTVAGRPIIAHGDEGPASGLRLLDADPASPTYLGTLGEWHLRDEVSIHNIMARGTRVYIAHYQDGVRVLDITDPTTPHQLAYYNTWQHDRSTAFYWSGALGLDLDPTRRRIYVVDLQRGLLILQADPSLFP